MNIRVSLNSSFYNFLSTITIFQACLEKKIFLPRFCYHSALKIAGNCRMCLVEEKSSLKPLASCAVSLVNGMVIHTHTEVVKKAREGVMEYLLINHPLDCPICDQGGECDLQDQSIVFGSDKGRFYEKKRTTTNKNFGFLIKSFLNRCIHCSRCTRFLQDIASVPALQLLGRGGKSEISNYVNLFIVSEISGNVIDLCPVGALTSKPAAFKARVWELTKVYTYDINDGFATNIQIDFRGLEVIRVLPKINKLQNEEWISDKTRFFYDAINNQRLAVPYLFYKTNVKKLNWLQSLLLLKNYIFDKTINWKKKKFIQVNSYFGHFLDFETALSYKYFSKFFRQTLKLKKKYYNANDFRINFFLNLQSFINFNEKKSRSVILFFLNLRFESPILNIIIKNFLENSFSKSYLIGFIHNANFPLHHLGTKIARNLINFLHYKNTNFHLMPLYYGIKFNDLTNRVANNLTELTKSELNIKSKEYDVGEIIKIECGNKEYPLLTEVKKNFFSVLLLHHNNEKYSNLTAFSTRDKLYLPTKFYFEKFSTFVNNAFIFFDTSCHFSYNLPQTKEEWKLFLSFIQVLGKEKNRKKDSAQIMKNITNKYLLKSKFFAQKTNNFKDNFFVKKFLSNSRVNDFYNTNIITDCSEILLLCSKKFTVRNDYIFYNLSY